MMVIFYLLLTARMGGCSNDHNFVTKTVDVGQNVTLSCIRQSAPVHQGTLFWIRLVSGNQLEFLGGTYSFDYYGVNNTSHITVKQEPGTFIMQISKTKLSDTGLYYCIKLRDLAVTFLEGTFLTIKGPEPDVIQVRSSDRIHSGDQETLQCSVLSKYEKKTCLENPSVYWFRAGSDKSHSIHVHGNSGDECERSPEAPSQRKCVYSFSRNVSSSDPGLYYCAVAICGQIIFGNESKLDIKANMWDLQTANTALFMLCAALVTSLMVIGFLIYTIKKKTCDCCNGSDGDQQGQQTEEDLMVYTVPTFTRRKNGKVERRNGKVTEGETVYSDVSVLAKN
ncbi:signal-regulatory protein beta-2-like isoform X2 [Oreochromis niloticus]|uniref:signal-regulatory protein beta-2-like isoform X2 n=1 Tax=Oreochromis niloticus TaxID=8128 RepID=UPI000DF48CAC|nr:signal-regulatory protein beta-2-like isoform X2 [Oreochromis niloticus]